jgi:hypothetical protein
MVDVALVRKRLRHAVDQARKDAVGRRERADAARQAFEVFLEGTAVPAFRAVANALRGEGLPFEVMTPSEAVRLVPDRNRDEGIMLELDSSTDPPVVMVSVTKGRGSRMTRTERPAKDGVTIDRITDDDLVELLIDELKPWMV